MGRRGDWYHFGEITVAEAVTRRRKEGEEIWIRPTSGGHVWS